MDSKGSKKEASAIDKIARKHRLSKGTTFGVVLS